MHFLAGQLHRATFVAWEGQRKGEHGVKKDGDHGCHVRPLGRATKGPRGRGRGLLLRWVDRKVDCGGRRVLHAPICASLSREKLCRACSSRSAEEKNVAPTGTMTTQSTTTGFSKAHSVLSFHCEPTRPVFPQPGDNRPPWHTSTVKGWSRTTALDDRWRALEGPTPSRHERNRLNIAMVHHT